MVGLWFALIVAGAICWAVGLNAVGIILVLLGVGFLVAGLVEAGKWR